MPSYAALTSLPPELLLEIMTQLADISILHKFIRSCKLLYRTYRAYRAEVVARSLHRIIGLNCGVAIEADSCITARDMMPSQFEVPKRALGDFLRTWRTRRAEQLSIDNDFQIAGRILYSDPSWAIECKVKNVAPAPQALKNWPAQDFVFLVRLHKQHVMIEYCVKRFCEKALAAPPVAHSLTLQEDELRRSPLSHTEHVRVYRAFYRLHLFSEIFHRKHWGVPKFETYCNWLRAFPPHETEEIATAYQWLDDEYVAKLRTIGDLEFRRQMDRALYVEEGLEALWNLCQEDNPIRVLSMAQRCSMKNLNQILSLGECLNVMPPYRNCHLCGNKNTDDGYPERGLHLAFDGDHQDCPNYGWLWSWNFRMSDFFYLCGHSNLRRYGHVMWDRDRLRSWKIFEKPLPYFIFGNWGKETDPYDLVPWDDAIFN